MLEFFKGHVIPTTPVNIAGSFKLLSDEEAKNITDTWDEGKLIDYLKKRLIVQQAMESKLRESPVHDNIRLN